MKREAGLSQAGDPPQAPQGTTRASFNMRAWCQSPKRSTTPPILHRELEPWDKGRAAPRPTAFEPLSATHQDSAGQDYVYGMAFTIIKGGVNYHQRFVVHFIVDSSSPIGPFLNVTIVSKLLTQGSLQEWLFGSSLFFFCNPRKRHLSFFQGFRFVYQVLHTSEHRVHIVNHYRNPAGNPGKVTPRGPGRARNNQIYQSVGQGRLAHEEVTASDAEHGLRWAFASFAESDCFLFFFLFFFTRKPHGPIELYLAMKIATITS